MKHSVPMAETRARSAVPDALGPDLDVVFVGINPDPISAREKHHFANPANGFWSLLNESGFLARPIDADDERSLIDLGIGVTNLVPRVTRGVAELTRDDLERGRRNLARKLARWRPRAVVFVGITAWRSFSGDTGTVVCGEQPRRARDARVFVLPNPSGRNAHFTHAEMRRLWREVARALGRG